ncbi:MAG: HRDC domain-containing protein [Myxococcota bacterium]
MTDEAPAPYAPPEDLGFRYVTDADGLAEAVAALEGTTVLAVDTESDSFYSYEESCCLVQITGDSGPDWVIDPLSVKDLSPLSALMADPSVVKIFHGADYDVVSLKRDFGFSIHGIFDTMIAAQAGGHDRFGLGDLVKKYFGVTLNKKYQRHDWSSRPLKPEHLAYARLDSHFLPKLMTILAPLAEENGRGAMLEEEFELLEGREWSRKPFSPDDCMKIKGATKLDGPARKVLRAVFLARDARARKRNRPAFKVWGNDVCLDVAAGKPTDKSALAQALGPNHHVVRRYPNEIVEAVKAGLADTSAAPKAPRPHETPRDPRLPPFTRDDEPLLAALKKWRNARAKSEEMAPGLIVNNAVMRGIAALKPASVDDLEIVPDMRRWQRVGYGELLVGVVAKWQERTAAEQAAKEAREAEGGGKKRRRRRRRRRGGQSKGGGEGAGAAQNAPTSSAPE